MLAKRDLKQFSDNIFIFAVLLIILITGLSFYEFNKLTKANNWVTHTYAVILTATNSIDLYHYIEGKQREYILFNDSEALQIYRLQITKMYTTLDQLAQLTKDNPEQRKRTHDYIQVINERVNLFNKAVDLKKLDKYTPALKNDIFARGKILSNEIGDIAQEILDQENLLLQERNNSLLNEINVVNRMVTLGQTLSILFLLAAFFAYRRNLNNRLEMEKNTKNLSTQLKSIIEGANDMIVALDEHYQYLIFNKAYYNEFKKIFGKEISIGQSLETVLADRPEARSILINIWNKSLEGDKTVKTLQFLIEGVLNTYELTPSLIKTEDGTTLGALHIIRNITERTKEQEQLKVSYMKLNAASEELKTKNDKITLLLEMSDTLLVTDSLEELNTIIPKYCNKILNFSSGNFYIMRPSKDILEINGQWGNPSIKTEVFTQNQCWALRLGRIHHSTLKPKELICAHVEPVLDKNLGYMCLPLRAKNEVFGLLYLEFDISENQCLSGTENLLITAFAEVMALALANVRLRDNLQYQSIRDPLTNLYNRRYLEDFLSRQLFLAAREETPLAVLMMDLDHFKRINDVHGHEAGDLVLKEFSRLLLTFVRRSDLATRYGGEEFVVIFYNSDKAGGMKRAEEIRDAVSHSNLKYGNQDIHLTVSIGVSSFPENAKDEKELLDRADKALYAAKKNGRNKVVHYDDIFEKEPVS